jgi:predicted nucleotidyltransferase
MKFGLKEDIIEKITEVFASVSEVDEVIIYGSRAKGENKRGSDIDIVLKGEKLTLNELNKISLVLDDLLLPYTFDLSIYHRINNSELLDHINRVGKTIYSRHKQ